MAKSAVKKRNRKNIEKVDFELLRNKLKLKNLEIKSDFSKKYPKTHELLKEKGLELSKVRQHSAKIIGAAGLTGTLLLSPPTGVKTLPAPQEISDKLKLAGAELSLEGPKKLLLDNLDSLLPKRFRPLAVNEEKILEQIVLQITGIKTKANLEGEHLNTTYGLIGAEQHLRRYPQDTLKDHGEGSVLKEGLAPGLGAWGYFASSKSEMDESLKEKEKWYAVVQTLYLPDWNTRQPYLRDWYKYRKVLIVNTKNGNSVIASIADSGPAAWTGKHFGGSPEVMDYLGGPRYKKGPVLVFFVDDPENKIPLGPVEYNTINLPEIALKT